MGTRTLMAALVLGWAGTAWSADGAGASTSSSDSAIVEKVKERLNAGTGFRVRGADVEAVDGVVILDGRVDSQAEKALAGEAARGVPGVRGVSNRLSIDARAREAAAADRESDRQDAKERRRVDRTDAGAATGAGDRFIGRLDDGAITSRVKSALGRQPGTAALKVNVDTRGGIVTLRGVALSQAEKDLAERYAREVQGVVDVDNRIQVR
jgi:hyperosmotically inducible protein